MRHWGCLSRSTFDKYFTKAQHQNHSTSVEGAGNNDLGLCGVYTLPVKYKDKKEIYRQYIVCNLDIDLIRIDHINELGISFHAKAKHVFSISDEPDIL